jgi:hypothetical protein
MLRKIFISYRREDSGANALGISQYLEHEFGPKNVFIDVDMRAGAKFPAVLEERLSECKVLLALIGPGWLNARDDQGNRRLDNPDDWVRLEIAHALRRNITVIPVRVNGASLPIRSALPDDVSGLLDHQAVSVSLAGFRHEMASLVRDIRLVPSQRRWPRPSLMVACASALVAILAIAGLISATNGIERIKDFAFPAIAEQNSTGTPWSGKPGEWVFYAVDKNPVAYYLKPSSIEMFGDRVAFASRFPVVATNTDKLTSQNAYEGDITVVDCKASQWALSERYLYAKDGKSTFHFKWGDPATLDLSIGAKVAPGTVISKAERILCDEKTRTALIANREGSDKTFTYLSSTATGDGDIFYDKPRASLDSSYQSDLPVLVKLHDKHTFADLFPGPTVLGLTQSSYQAYTEPLQLNCRDRKIQIPNMEYFDGDGYLLDFDAFMPVQQIDVKANPFTALLKIGCAGLLSNVAGTYEGTDHGSTKTGGNGEEKISIIVTQKGDAISVTFHTAAGGEGRGVGTLTDETVESIPIQSTTPNCSGSYLATLKFDGDTVTWSYKGQDCNGPIEGYGSAKRTSV